MRLMGRWSLRRWWILSSWWGSGPVSVIDARENWLAGWQGGGPPYSNSCLVDMVSPEEVVPMQPLMLGDAVRPAHSLHHAHME